MWPFAKHDTIDVRFVDERSGDPVARSYTPVAQLPESFAPDTTVEIAGKPYSVARAQPLTKREFRKSGRLVLRVTPIMMIDPSAILFSLPTIDDRWPSMEPAADQPAGLSMHEDDWRQIEFISSELGAEVDSQLDAVREVMSEARKGGAYTRIHVRDRITTPITQALRPSEVAALLGISRGSPSPIRIDRMAGRVRDGGALRLSDRLWAYWFAPDDQVAVLGLHGQFDADPKRWEPVLRAGLILVDWCRAQRIG